LREVPLVGGGCLVEEQTTLNVLRVNISRPAGTLFKEGVTRYYLKCFISSRSKFHFLIITIIKNLVSPLVDVEPACAMVAVIALAMAKTNGCSPAAPSSAKG
jgi:hypothetical protein